MEESEDGNADHGRKLRLLAEMPLARNEMHGC
jgi:hypothetical protein